MIAAAGDEMESIALAFSNGACGYDAPSTGEEGVRRWPTCTSPLLGNQPQGPQYPGTSFPSPSARQKRSGRATYASPRFNSRPHPLDEPPRWRHLAWIIHAAPRRQPVVVGAALAAPHIRLKHVRE